MNNNFSGVITEIKKQLSVKYPNVRLNVSNEDEDYNFSIDNRELYYSDDFQLFVFKLKQRLWEQNIHNIYFILDNQKPISLPKNPLKIDTIVEEAVG
jgi:hypothetical protein